MLFRLPRMTSMRSTFRFSPLRPLLAGAALLLLAAGCSRAAADRAALPPKDAGAPVAAVRVARPLARLDASVARATGELRSKLSATLSPQASGTIAKVHVATGDRVRKGDPILELDTSNLLIQLDQARAAHRMARAAREVAAADLGRTRSLFEAGSAPQAVMDKVAGGAEQAEAAVLQADAQVRAIEEALRDHVLRAPFDGVVTARLKNVGDYVAMTPPTAVATLTSVSAIEVRLSVPEGLVDRLRSGQVLRGRALPGGAAFQGKVTSVGAVVDPATRAVEVLADVAAAPGALLRPGALAEVDLGGSAAGEGPLVPAQAVGKDGERRFVWTVAGDAVRRRDVEVEAVTPQWVRLRAGVGADEPVVIEGGGGLADGQRVAVAR
jgi:RND family efflux transporter MFP subunit